MSKEEAIEILSEIKENVNTCCAITMEPDEVLEEIRENVQTCCAITMDPDDVESLIDELEDILNRMYNTMTGQK